MTGECRLLSTGVVHKKSLRKYNVRWPREDGREEDKPREDEKGKKMNTEERVKVPSRMTWNSWAAVSCE